MRMIRTILAAAAFATMSLAAGAGAAQPGCAPRDVVLNQLAARYGEAVVAAGLTIQGLLLEVLAAGDGATWTIIATSPAGLTCLLAVGEGWRATAEAPGPPA